MAADQQAPTSTEFLLFSLQENIFALSAAVIREVVPPRPVTPLPFVPPHVDGLVNVGERVLPQLNMQRLLGSALSSGQMVENAAMQELMVIESRRAPYVICVDRIIGKQDVLSEDIRVNGESTDDADDAYLSITAEFEADGKTVLVLDADRLAGIITPSELPEGQRGFLGRDTERVQTNAVTERIDCLIAEVGNERYAFRLADVMEVVDECSPTPLPAAPDYILGLALVRDDLLLTVHLGKLLNISEQHLGSAKTMLVMESDGERYGLCVNRVTRIVSFANESLRPVNDESSDISGVLIKDDKIHTLVTPKRLLNKDRTLKWRRFLPENSDSSGRAQVKYARIFHMRLAGEELGLPLEAVRRVAGYTPPDALSGDSGQQVISAITSVGGVALPVIDLCRALQISCHQTASAWVIVGKDDRDAAAVAVDEAYGILEIPVDQIDQAAQSGGSLIESVATVDNRLMSLLDAATLCRWAAGECNGEVRG